MTAPDDVIDRRYRLLDVAGRGGAAEVWRARDERLDRTVAVKLFRPGATDTAARERAELEVMARLSHPGLVTMYDGGTITDRDGVARTFLVMEFVDGVTLRQLLGEGALGPRPAARIGGRLAEGLAHIHAHAIVHRDIKPANILLRGETVKLADFGVARILDGARMTEVGTTVGTANYLSPEQVRGADITAASDVYSLGLVVIEMITGAIVYPGSGVSAAVARLHRPPVLPPCGPEWTALLRGMIADDPAARPSAQEVALRLAALTAAPAEVAAPRSLPVAVSSDPLPSMPTAAVADPVIGQPRARASWWLAAGVAAVAAVVVGGLLSSGGGNDAAAAGTSPGLIAGRPHLAASGTSAAAPSTTPLPSRSHTTEPRVPVAVAHRVPHKHPARQHRAVKPARAVAPPRAGKPGRPGAAEPKPARHPKPAKPAKHKQPKPAKHKQPKPPKPPGGHGPGHPHKPHPHG
jgi:hypothetical protein